MSQDRPLSVNDYLKTAQRYAIEERADKVGETLHKGVEQHPNSVELISHYAFFCWKMGYIVQAEKLFLKRNELINPDAETCLLLSHLYEKMHDTKQVQHWLDRLSTTRRLRLHEQLRYRYVQCVNRLKEHYQKITHSSMGIRLLNTLFWTSSQITVCLIWWIEKAFPSFFNSKYKSSPVSFRAFLHFLWKYDPVFIQSKLAYHKCREIILTTQCLSQNKASSILDIGTGENPLVLYWASLGYSVTGLDGSLYGCSHLEKIKNKIEMDRGQIEFQYAIGDMCNLPFEENSYDTVTAICAIEHLPDESDTQCLQEIYRVLKPGGKAIITVETSGFYSEDWMAVPYERGYQIGKEEVSTQSWQEVFCRNYSLDEMKRRLIQSSNWKVNDIGFYDDFNFPIRTWTDPLQHQILPVILQPFVPLLSCVFYRMRTFSTKLTPSSIGYILLEKTE